MLFLLKLYQFFFFFLPKMHTVLASMTYIFILYTLASIKYISYKYKVYKAYINNVHYVYLQLCEPLI